MALAVWWGVDGSLGKGGRGKRGKARASGGGGFTARTRSDDSATRQCQEKVLRLFAWCHFESRVQAVAPLGGSC
jgi:hypothetical protein